MRICLPHDFSALIPGFLNNRQKDLVSLQEALNHQDFKTISELGHRLSGNGATYGFSTISTCGQNLEQAAIMQDPVAIKKEIQTLANYLEELEVVYE